MYGSWLDRWDERRAGLGDEVKKVAEFALDSELGFPNAPEVTSFAEFCDLADAAVTDPTFFDCPTAGDLAFERQGSWLKFPSDMSTDIEENNVVWAKVTDSGSFDQVLVVFHHWNATARNSQLASFLSRCGITVVEIALPYHFERSRPGSIYADYMLSPNLGRTIQSVRQAVWDGRKLIMWLKREGYSEVSVLGMSLGSWVAGLVAAHDSAVSRAALFLTAGSLADMVLTGRATRAIHDSLEPFIELNDLRRSWGPLNLENYANGLARHDLDLQVVLAKRDTVVLSKLSEQLVKRLKEAGAKPDLLELNCGHYSLAKPPYILLAGMNLRRFLMRGN